MDILSHTCQKFFIIPEDYSVQSSFQIYTLFNFQNLHQLLFNANLGTLLPKSSIPAAFWNYNYNIVLLWAVLQFMHELCVKISHIHNNHPVYIPFNWCHHLPEKIAELKLIKLGKIYVTNSNIAEHNLN